MRLLGTLPEHRQAQVFADYLLTQGIPAKVLEEAGTWELWVQNEDQVAGARELWDLYRSHPQDPRFPQAASAAKVIKQKEAAAERQWQMNFRSTRHLWGRPDPKQVPATMLLIAACVAVFFYTGMGYNANVRWFTFADPVRLFNADDLARLEGQFPGELPPREVLQTVGRTYLYTGTSHIQHGEVWRVLSPILLHFGIMHLAFNMYALFGLGGLVEYKRGWVWYLCFVSVTGVVSNCCQYFFPDVFNFLEMSPNAGAGSLAPFGGMSGVLYALFGYLWMKTAYAPEPGLYLPRDLIWLMLLWLVLCMTGLVGSIANTAHVSGLVCGMLIGAGPKWLTALLKK